MRTKRIGLTVLCTLLALTLCVILLPSSARADGEDPAPSGGSGISDGTSEQERTEDIGDDDVAVSEPASPASTAQVEEINDEASGGTVTDRMESKTEYDVLSNYTFDNEPVAEVPNPDPNAAEPLVPADNDTAIQRTVKKALSEITSETTSLVITVNDGAYDGDVLIKRPTTGVTMKDDLTVVIAAADAVEKDADGNIVRDGDDIRFLESAGGVKVNGNFTVDGFDVVLAGLYLSLGSKVFGSNTDLTVIGTALGDNIDVELTKENSSLTVDGKGGGDSISVALPKSSTVNAAPASAGDIQIVGGDGNDTVSIFAAAENPDRDAGITIETDDGDDTVNVSTTVARAAKEVTVDTGDGAGDRVHFTGAVAENVTDAIRLEDVGAQRVITFKTGISDSANKPLSLAVRTEGVETFTDALSNKPTVYFTHASPLNNDNVQSFTNYVYGTSGESAESIHLTDAIDISKEGAFLSNLQFSADAITVAASINAPGLNVSFFGKSISFQKTASGDDISIVGASVTVTAFDSDTQFGFDVKNHETATGTYDVAFSMFDVVSTADIDIAAGVAMTAKTGALSLSATTSQIKGMVDLAGATGSLNFVNVKVGSATVDIFGTLRARSAVSISARATATLVSNNALLSKAFVPLAVGVVVIEASVTLGDTASVTSEKASVSVSSETNVSVKSQSTTGKLPVSLSAGVAVIHSNVLVEGSVAATEGDVTLSAVGNASVTSNATKGTDAAITNVFGGFFAFSVVIQNVKASVEGAGEVHAPQGNVSILSNADERVSTTATSGAPAADGSQGGAGGGGTMGGVKTMLTGLLGKVVEKTDAVGKAKSALSGAVSKVTSKILGGSGTLIQTESAENGTVDAPAKASPGAAVTVTVTPSEGFKLDALQYTVLRQGSNAFETVPTPIPKNADGKYIFTIPTNAAAIVIAATFLSGAEDADEDGGVGLNEMFAEEDEESLGLEELFDEGAAGAAGDAKASDAWYHNPSGKSADGGYAVNGYFEGAVGAVLANAAFAKAGDTVRLLINPAALKAYKADTLQILKADGLTPTGLTPTKVGDAEYTFVMPANAVKITAAFETKTNEMQTATGGGSAAGQVTGALAATVALNTNNAFIDTIGEVAAAALPGRSRTTA